MKKSSQKAGNKVKTTTVIFVPLYLGREIHCGRHPCDTNCEERSPNCRRSNILYESACMVCNPTDNVTYKTDASELLSSPQEDLVHPSTQKPGKREGIYIGESSRSLHERSSEHENDAQNLTCKSHFIKHWIVKHPDLPARPPFRFKITTKYRDALSRQVGEAMRIMMSRDELLNSKSEYVRNCITISEKDWEKRERERLEEDQEKQEKENLEEFICEKAPGLQPAGRGTIILP